MQKLVLSFYGATCPQSINYVNALISAGVPFAIKYKPVSLWVIVKPKYAYRALLANYNLACVPLPAPIVSTNYIVFNIS